MDSVLEIQNLSFSFGPKLLFQGLDLRLAPGESYALWGPGGSGKSTLLRIVAGLLPAAGGSLRVLDTEIFSASQRVLQNLRARLGLVFQEGALISNMSIFDNIALPLRYHTGAGEAEVARRVGGLMATLGLDREADRSLPALATARVRKLAAIARALILEPALLLCDEPTAGLEEASASRVVETLKGYQEKSGAALLLATLDASLAASLANRLGILGKDGILGEGPPQEILAGPAKDGKP